MQTVTRSLLLTLLLLLPTSCITLPTQDTKTSYISYAGDRDSIQLSEIVVSVGGTGGNDPFRNLHVCLAAAVNPAQASLTDTWKVRDFVRRIEPRIAARVVAQAVGRPSITTGDLNFHLKNELPKAAQEVVNEALSQWKHKDDYSVEILLVSLYLTDGSVGRPQEEARRFW